MVNLMILTPHDYNDYNNSNLLQLVLHLNLDLNLNLNLNLNWRCLLAFSSLPSLALLLFFPLHSTLTVPLLFGARMSTIATFTVACIYASELYPMSVRASGTGLASTMGRIGGMVCPLVAVAVGLVAASHQTAAILLFEFVLLLTALSVLFFQSETKGQALNDTLSA